MLRYVALIALPAVLLYPTETDHIRIADMHIDMLPIVKKHVKKGRTIEQILRNPLGG
jgi:hypothetical protein